MSDDLISRRALYDKAATLEAQAMDYLRKLIERDGEETSVEWRIWSAILTERTAFKHDVYDAPSAQRTGRWTPVSEGLPEAGECVGNVIKYYLVQNEFGDMLVAKYTHSGYWEQIYQYKPCADEIVAWMPLPPSYKEEQE